ncbi:MAG TPA: histidine kinase [Pseudoxanthomonas sp.]|nr:histidine kinase [Pseudoxanthomonas sp.]
MSTPDQNYSLRHALPSDVLVGGHAVWSRYRQYPVFSWPWLKGRTLLFMAVMAVVAGVIGFGVGLVVRDYRLGLYTGALEFAAFALMATTGPAFATWVRHRRWSEGRERGAVVVAVLLGMGVSFAADHFASAEIERVIMPVLGVPELPQAASIGSVERAAALVVNLATLAVVYGLFGGGLALRAYFSERRRWRAHRHQGEVESLKRQARDADLRLGLLQAQVEPHFLFNTLASVRALVRQDPAQAEATLDALVAFLRASIPRLRDGETSLHSTLGQQLDLCASYLALMQVRTGGRLGYRIEAEAGLRERPFPPALLITLVENAIKHGIEPQPGPGRVDVLADVHQDRLRVRVVDDGAGLQPGIGGGMGLANVREQLAGRFGDAAHFRLRALSGRGASAEIEIPMEPPA